MLRKRSLSFNDYCLDTLPAAVPSEAANCLLLLGGQAFPRPEATALESSPDDPPHQPLRLCFGATSKNLLRNPTSPLPALRALPLLFFCPFCTHRQRNSKLTLVKLSVCASVSPDCTCGKGEAFLFNFGSQNEIK